MPAIHRRAFLWTEPHFGPSLSPQHPWELELLTSSLSSTLPHPRRVTAPSHIPTGAPDSLLRGSSLLATFVSPSLLSAQPFHPADDITETVPQEL